MSMSYRMYLERRKALDEQCAYTEQQYAQAIALRDRAVGKMDAAEANLDNGSEELRAERELRATREHSSRGCRRYGGGRPQKSAIRRCRSARISGRSILAFEEAAKERISPTDRTRPPTSDVARTINEYLELGKGAIDTGLMTGGMIAQDHDRHPDVQEQATPRPSDRANEAGGGERGQLTRSEHTGMNEAHMSAPPGEMPPEIAENQTKKEREEEREKERQKELAEGRETEEKKEVRRIADRSDRR